MHAVYIQYTGDGGCSQCVDMDMAILQAPSTMHQVMYEVHYNINTER